MGRSCLAQELGNKVYCYCGGPIIRWDTLKMDMDFDHKQHTCLAVSWILTPMKTGQTKFRHTTRFFRMSCHYCLSTHFIPGFLIEGVDWVVEVAESLPCISCSGVIIENQIECPLVQHRLGRHNMKYFWSKLNRSGGGGGSGIEG